MISHPNGSSNDYSTLYISFRDLIANNIHCLHKHMYQAIKNKRRYADIISIVK